jgi:uncharacterized protein
MRDPAIITKYTPARPRNAAGCAPRGEAAGVPDLCAGSVFLIVLLVVGGFSAMPREARAEIFVEDPGGYTVDMASVMDGSDEREIGRVLDELEARTGAEVKVLTVKSTNGESIESFAQRHAEAWSLGEAKRNNGVLVVIAVDDHMMRIHLGAGLAEQVPNRFCQKLIDEVYTPAFKEDRYSSGILEGTCTLAAEIAAQNGLTLKRLADPNSEGEMGPVLAILVVGAGGLLVASLIVGSAIWLRHRAYGGPRLRARDEYWEKIGEPRRRKARRDKQSDDGGGTDTGGGCGGGGSIGGGGSFGGGASGGW